MDTEDTERIQKFYFLILYNGTILSPMQKSAPNTEKTLTLLDHDKHNWINKYIANVPF